MKKFFISFIALCSIWLGMVLYAETIPTKGYVEPDIGLNVRTGPSTNFSKIGALEKGKTVKITSVVGKWYQISSPMSGYVYAEHIIVTEYGDKPNEEKDDETTLSEEEIDKIGCDIDRSLKNAKLSSKVPQNK